MDYRPSGCAWFLLIVSTDSAVMAKAANTSRHLHDILCSDSDSDSDSDNFIYPRGANYVHDVAATKDMVLVPFLGQYDIRTTGMRQNYILKHQKILILEKEKKKMAPSDVYLNVVTWMLTALVISGW